MPFIVTAHKQIFPLRGLLMPSVRFEHTIFPDAARSLLFIARDLSSDPEL
jgi:hypothetical protein